LACKDKDKIIAQLKLQK